MGNPQDHGPDNSSSRMTILSHLMEIRTRLFRSVVAIVITTIAAFIFADPILKFLIAPLKGTPLIFIDMTEMIGIYMKVCLTVGICAAMPYLIYEFLAFVTPALKSNEKKYIYMALPFIFVMFAGGIAFSYFVMLPPAVNFLTSFGTGIAAPQIRISSYYTVVTRVILATGIIFELPVISTFLSWLGVINSRWLGRQRKWAIILAFVVGALVTPTPDPINQSLVALPLIALYEISIWLAWLVQRRKVRAKLTAEVEAETNA
jgi:sec-independent protein translocase protein TatC